MSVSVKVVSHKDKVMQECDQKIGVALESVAQDAASFAIMACPADTGRLKNSITAVARKKDGMTHTPANTQDGQPADPDEYRVRGEPPVNSVAVGTNVRYAERIELGSSIQAPSGFLRVTLEEHLGEYKKLFETALK